MFILKMFGKFLLFPVWVIFVVVGIIVKVTVHAISVAKAILGLGLTALIIGTIICYQDWLQVAFLLCMSAVMFLILFAGVFVEEMIGFARKRVEELFLA